MSCGRHMSARAGTAAAWRPCCAKKKKGNAGERTALLFYQLICILRYLIRDFPSGKFNSGIYIAL